MNKKRVEMMVRSFYEIFAPGKDLLIDLLLLPADGVVAIHLVAAADRELSLDRSFLEKYVLFLQGVFRSEEVTIDEINLSVAIVKQSLLQLTKKVFNPKRARRRGEPVKNNWLAKHDKLLLRVHRDICQSFRGYEAQVGFNFLGMIRVAHYSVANAFCLQVDDIDVSAVGRNVKLNLREAAQVWLNAMLRNVALYLFLSLIAYSYVRQSDFSLFAIRPVFGVFIFSVGLVLSVVSASLHGMLKNSWISNGKNGERTNSLMVSCFNQLVEDCEIAKTFTACCCATLAQVFSAQRVVYSAMPVRATMKPVPYMGEGGKVKDLEPASPALLADSKPKMRSRRGDKALHEAAKPMPAASAPLSVRQVVIAGSQFLAYPILRSNVPASFYVALHPELMEELDRQPFLARVQKELREGTKFASSRGNQGLKMLSNRQAIHGNAVVELKLRGEERLLGTMVHVEVPGQEARLPVFILLSYVKKAHQGVRMGAGSGMERGVQRLNERLEGLLPEPSCRVAMTM